MRILLVEDDHALGEGIRTALRPEGYTVDWLQDGASALHALNHELRAGDPRSRSAATRWTGSAQRLRAAANPVPVLVLTARDATGDRIAGLDAGADDYLVKPFDVAELKARLRALLRRSFNRPEPVLEYRGILLDPVNQQVSYQGTPINLPRKEFVLLHELLAQPGRVLTRDRLQQVLYGWDEDVESNALEVHIHHLRKVLSRADPHRARASAIWWTNAEALDPPAHPGAAARHPAGLAEPDLLAQLPRRAPRDRGTVRRPAGAKRAAGAGPGDARDGAAGPSGPANRAGCGGERSPRSGRAGARLRDQAGFSGLRRGRQQRVAVGRHRKAPCSSWPRVRRRRSATWPAAITRCCSTAMPGACSCSTTARTRCGFWSASAAMCGASWWARSPGAACCPTSSACHCWRC